MLETIEKIIRANDLAVLATCAENQPHCSLMAYVPNNDCRTIYMLTQKDSRKFRNISANARVSLMVDTRFDDQKSRPTIKALTISGTCKPSAQSMQKQLKDLLAQNHPQLKTLSAQKDAIVLEITIKSFLLLDGIDNAFFMELSEQQKF
jgi:nitroimidazol reductase NimA-like FMN-containing flavoprotein (pyridoxamine 5'-phosphate oxidase superfamily)